MPDGIKEKKMSQKKINQFFSSSNLPPKKREREEELSESKKVDVNKNKKKKSTEVTDSVQTENNKRKPEIERAGNEKKLRKEGTRERMEEEAERLNENFDQCGQRRENGDDWAEKISIETININSLIESSRFTRMKAVVKYWENDITVLVDTRIKKYKARWINTEGFKTFSTDKPFRGVIIKIRAVSSENVLNCFLKIMLKY